MATLKQMIRKIYYKQYIKRKILSYYKHKADITPEQKEVVDFLSHNPCSTYPYEFMKNFNSVRVVVNRDAECGLKYVVIDGKRLYFKRSWSNAKIIRGVRYLIMEQNEASPHRYLTPFFDVSPDDVVADIGCADGNFSLSIVDRVKHIYLFEMDDQWIEALQQSFAPWRDKVTIIHKMVSQENNDKNISLDEFTKSHPITFVKGDLEGFEEQVLKGGKSFMTRTSPLKAVITTYHLHEHGEVVWNMLSSYGFQCRYSRGYMVMKNMGDLRPPYLRRGLVYGAKE